MTRHDDVDRRISSWLISEFAEEEPTYLANVLAHVGASRQRPAWVARLRLPQVERLLPRLDFGPAALTMLLIIALLLALLAAVATPGRPPLPLPSPLAVLPTPEARIEPPVPDSEARTYSAFEFRGNDFYAAAEPLPPGSAGDLIYLLRIANDDQGRVYRVLYHSRSVDGRDVASSGTIWVPASAPHPDGYPIVSFAAGDLGPADPCAMSRLGDSDVGIDNLNAIEVSRLRREGYVVAFTDYQGHGTPGPYPASVLQAAGHDVLDVARAARGFLPDATSDRVILFGRPNGADAVTSAAEVAEEYAPDLDIRGVIAAEGGGGDHEMALARAIQQNPDATGLLITVDGYTVAFPELVAADVLTPAALEFLPDLDQYCFDPLRDHIGDLSIREALRVDPMKLGRWAARIRSMKVTRAPFPTYLMAAGRDDPLALDDVRDLAHRFCAANDAIILRIYPDADPPPTRGEDMFTGVLPASWDDIRGWMAERVAGVATAGNCGRAP
jgi:hypothetical protein